MTATVHSLHDDGVGIVGRTRSLLSPSRLDQSSETGTSAIRAPRLSSLIRISALQAKPGSRMKPSPWRS